MAGVSAAMPTPRITRPSAMRSSVPTIWASTTGLRSAGQQDGGAEAHPPGARGDGGEEGQRLVPRPRGERVADPHGVEAGGLRALGHGQHRGCLRATGHDRLASGEQDAELDRHERASWVPSIVR
jgi:hypothetical protein